MHLTSLYQRIVMTIAMIIPLIIVSPYVLPIVVSFRASHFDTALRDAPGRCWTGMRDIAPLIHTDKYAIVSDHQVPIRRGTV